MFLEALLGVVSTVSVGSGGWLIHLGNRVTKIETQYEDLPKYLDAKFESLASRLDRIERGMNGRIH